MQTKSPTDATPVLIIIFLLLAAVNLLTGELLDALLWGVIGGGIALTRRIETNSPKRSQILAYAAVGIALILVLARILTDLVQ